MKPSHALRRPSPATAMTAGLALIVITNAVALGGAAYNRSGEPDSTLRLTDRELRPPYVLPGNRENSGLSLQLRWRVLSRAAPDGAADGFQGEGGGSPAWLDGPKMASLGFDTQGSTAPPVAGERTPFQRQLPRDVLVVLELDGPARQQALARADHAANQVAARNDQGAGEKNAHALIDGEANQSSRLFAVDAGLDREALRRKFADRTKYAIVRGQVRPAQGAGGAAKDGYIEGLSVPAINVPLPMRGALEGVTPSSGVQDATHGGHFEATVAFGQRLEPWLLSLGRP